MVSRDRIQVPFLPPLDPVPSDWRALAQRAVDAANALQEPVILSAWRASPLPEQPQSWPGAAAADRVLWWQPDHWRLAIGAVQNATLEGPGRELHLARRTARWRARCISNDEQQLPIIFLHSFSERFNPTRPSAWGPWSAGSHVRIPKYFVHYQGNGAGRIAHQLIVDPDSNIDAVIKHLCEQPEPVGPLQHAPFPAFSPTKSFVDLVDEGRSLVELGALRKIVLARSEDMQTSLTIDAWDVLNQLRQDHDKTSTAYLCDLPVGGSFVGLTPERLFALSGKELSTHALAGSRARSQDQEKDTELAQELLTSTKERKEHQLVVELLTSQLNGRATKELNIPSTPSIRKLATVQHLETEITCRLKHADPWDLLFALHPTPAICGLPVDAARTIIDRLEGLDRGLYAGAIGWLLGSKSEAIVPLRGGIVAGNRARLFAGAGIVETSDPELEFKETELKLGVMQRAIKAATERIP